MGRSTCVLIAALAGLASFVCCLGPPKAVVTEAPKHLSGKAMEETRNGDRPLQGALVSLVVDGEALVSTHTDPQGGFSFAQVPSRAFDVHVEKEGYLPWRMQEQRGKLVDPEGLKWQNGYIGALLARPPTVLTGRVLSQKGGAGVAEAQVRTYPPTTEVATAGDGRYVLASSLFEPGVDFRVEVAQPQHVGFLSEPFQASVGDTLRLLDVSLRELKPEFMIFDPVRNEYVPPPPDPGIVVPSDGRN